jgi:hypothetical protein
VRDWKVHLRAKKKIQNEEERQEIKTQKETLTLRRRLGVPFPKISPFALYLTHK